MIGALIIRTTVFFFLSLAVSLFCHLTLNDGRRVILLKKKTAWEIIITCDCCGSIELRLHRDGLYVNNACSQDVTLTAGFKGLTVRGVQSQNNHIKVLIKEYFFPALCVKQRAFYSLMCHFKLRSPPSFDFCPFDYATLSTWHCPNTKPAVFRDNILFYPHSI